MPLPIDRHTELGRGYTAALAAAVILSTTGIIIRHLTQTYQMPPLVLAFWRDTLVTAALALTLVVIRPDQLKIGRAHLGYLAIYGLVLAIFNGLWTVSVALNGAAVSTVLVYSSAGFTVLLGRLLLQERLNWGRLLAVVISLGGCVFVSGAADPAAWSTNLAGILTGILSGLLYAAYSLMGRQAALRGLNPWTTLLYTFGFAALFLLSTNLLSALPSGQVDLFWLGGELTGWGWLLLLAAGPTLVGFGLYNVSLSYLPSGVANLILTLDPVFTAVIAFFLLGEWLDGVQVAGSLMVMSGVVFLRLNEERYR